MPVPRRLLSVSHSYVVALNRRLADEMARAGAGTWEVVAVAPKFMHGDLRPIALEPSANGCRTEPVRVYGSRYVHVMGYGRRLRTILREGWDLVHSWEEPYIFAGFQVCRWTPPRTPLVFWTAQNLSKRYPPPFNWFERYVVNRCAGWLACGQTVVETLGPRGYSAKPHRVMPLGVDVAAFRPDLAAGAAVRQTLGWKAEGPPVVGYLGRFVPEKGVRLLMRVLNRLRTPWRALFVGGGFLEGELRTWAARHGDRVQVVTGVSHDRVPQYLNAMDVLAAPSQTIPQWREQLGRMLIEAFSCGVAVVGSDSGEVPHVIADAGLIVPEADTDAWVSALGGLLENPARRAELAAQGLARAQAEFAWQVIARRHLAFFDELLSSRDKRPSREASSTVP